jgi:hypothetical protein
VEQPSPRKKTQLRRDQAKYARMAPTTPVAEVSHVALWRPEYFSQNLTKSAGKCAHPFRPKKLIPRRFWAIPISFLSRKRESRLTTRSARVGISRAEAKIE